VIIWTRWGILVLGALLAGAVLGSQTLTALGVPAEYPQSIAMMLWFGALISLALTLWAFPRIDKPRPAMLERALPEPIVDEKGRTKETEIVQAVDADGNGLLVTPQSTFFFIPARFYWIIFAVIALVPTAEWIFRR
jgi:hypothetical protein